MLGQSLAILQCIQDKIKRRCVLVPCTNFGANAVKLGPVCMIRLPQLVCIHPTVDGYSVSQYFIFYSNQEKEARKHVHQKKYCKQREPDVQILLEVNVTAILR